MSQIDDARGWFPKKWQALLSDDVSMVFMAASVPSYIHRCLKDKPEIKSAIEMATSAEAAEELRALVIRMLDAPGDPRYMSDLAPAICAAIVILKESGSASFEALGERLALLECGFRMVQGLYGHLGGEVVHAFDDVPDDPGKYFLRAVVGGRRIRSGQHFESCEDAMNEASRWIRLLQIPQVEVWRPHVSLSVTIGKSDGEIAEESTSSRPES